MKGKRGSTAASVPVVDEFHGQGGQFRINTATGKRERVSAEQGQDKPVPVTEEVKKDE